MTEPLGDLVDLTRALYEAEAAKMRDLVKREAELRRALEELAQHRRDSLTMPDMQLAHIRQIGADVLWLGWIDRSRQELNTQLAQVLGKKERMMGAVRTAFGKMLAAQDILNKAQNFKRQKMRRSER